MGDVRDLLREAVGSYEPHGDQRAVESRVQLRRRAHRLSAGVLALGVFAAAAWLAWAAFQPSESTLGSTDSGTYLLSGFEVGPHVDPATDEVVPGQADVTFTTRWSSNEYPGVHRCELMVFDAAAQEIGSLRFEMLALSQRRSPPHLIPVTGSIEGATATGWCDPERLDVPVAYVISNEHLAHVDGRLSIVYEVAHPEGIASDRQISSQACTSAVWDGDGRLLGEAHFTLTGAPEGERDTGVGVDNEAPISEANQATVTCVPYVHENEFPDPKPPTSVFPEAGNGPSMEPTGSFEEGQLLVTVYSSDGGDFDIYRMNADGTGLAPLMADPSYRDTQAVTSPELTKIAFVRSAAPTPNGLGGSTISGGSDIYVMDLDGSHLVRLTDQPPGGPSHDEPAWSPDGTTIAYRSNQAGSLDIWAMNADGSDKRRLTNGGSNGEPLWSPDGTKIVFDSDRARSSPFGLNIWVMDADGSDPVRLTTGDAGDIVTSWSPDGTKIAFQRSVYDSDYAWDVWVMNADGANQRQLTDWPGRDVGALWSPDGSQLLFQSDRYIDVNQAEKTLGGSGSWPDAVYVMRVDGSNVVQIVPPDRRVWPSSWPPSMAAP